MIDDSSDAWWEQEDMKEQEAAERDEQSELAPPFSSGEANPLVLELQSLATNEHPLCQESRLLLQMAVDAQLGKPIDVSRLLQNTK